MKGYCQLLLVAALQISCICASSCDWRYYQHYEQRGCKPVLGDNGCPAKFQCKTFTSEDRQKCYHAGKTYAKGEQIQDLSECDTCTCLTSRDDEDAVIECASVDCPDWEPKNKSCYMGYTPGQCCPREMCPGDPGSGLTCEYNGKTYKNGQYIQTGQPCKSCICTKDWRGDDGPGCQETHCLTGIFAKKIRSGCLPIYGENVCCITEVYCDDIYGATPVLNPGSDREDFCHYQGKYYERGSTVYLSNDKYKTITCRCNVPPDFTCIRKSRT